MHPFAAVPHTAVSLAAVVAVRTAVAHTEEDHMVVAHMVAVTSADTDKKSRRNHFGDEMAQSLFQLSEKGSALFYVNRITTKKDPKQNKKSKLFCYSYFL